MNLSFSAAYKAIFFLIFFLSSIIYPVFYYVGLYKHTPLANLIIVALLLIISASPLILNVNNIKHCYISYSFLLIAFIIFWMIAISLVKNSFTEYIPSAFRYLLYLSVFSSTFLYASWGKIKSRYINFIILTSLIIGIVFGLVEVLAGKVQYLNGAYRLTGNFTGHSLGYALYMFIPIFYMLTSGELKKNVFSILLLLSGLVLFLYARSRALTILLICSYPLAKFVIEPRMRKKIYSIFAGGLFILVGLYIVLNYDYFPRLQEFILGEGIDNSTAFRIFIFETTIENLRTVDYLVGLGIGAFNNFFYGVTGLDGVAAHNDYLLVLAEGGIIILFLYVLYQALIVIKFKKIFKSDILKRKLVISCLGLFLTYEVFSFLLNVHYFYQSEVLLFLILGYLFGNYQYKINVSLSKN